MAKVIIIGGGAAGMIAAYSAALTSNKVYLLEKNEKLGKKRAENVANEIRNSTDPAKVKVNSVRSAGEKEPAFPNDTAEGRRKNRRVEINFKGWFDQQEDIH